jgi:hypothetical protein
MQIITDEREILTSVTCENCGKHRPGRRCENYGLFNEHRGWWSLCFVCFPRRIQWRATRGKYWSPVEITGRESISAA